jgi:hypothetical protein
MGYIAKGKTLLVGVIRRKSWGTAVAPVHGGHFVQ